MKHLLDFLSSWGPLPTWWQCVFMIVAILLNDMSWVYYTRRVGAGKPMQAGYSAVAIWLTGALAAIAYISNHWLVIVGAIATFFGTAATVWFDHSRSKETNEKV